MLDHDAGSAQSGVAAAAWHTCETRTSCGRHPRPAPDPVSGLCGRAAGVRRPTGARARGG
eukprot:2397552-Prymnesium_polylepis.1